MSRPQLLAGKYLLLRPIAAGGMAEVFLARQTGAEGFEKLVVVKRILPELAARPGFKEMFIAEARNAADLRHTNIVGIYDIVEDGGSWFIVMEYLHGPTLRELIRTADFRGGVPIAHAVQIGIEAASALHYAHEKKDLSGRPLRIVHRDVKPSNLVITFEGITKLLDFGIARTRGSRETVEPTSVAGTAAYMSPEQATGRAIDARTDQFSLGVVLFELTTGKRLFAGETDYVTLQRVVRCEVPRPSTLVENYPAPVEAALLRALAREPADRFESCQALADALVDFAESSGLLSSPMRIARYLAELMPERSDTLATGGRSDRTQTDLGEMAGPGPAWMVRAEAETKEESRGNLPSSPDLFVGRAADLDAIGEQFDSDTRLVTLLGPAGSGKTRLSLQYGELQAEQSRFDSLWFIDVSEASDRSGLLTAVSGVLGVPLNATRDEKSAIQILGAALASRGHALFIFDNFEHLRPLAADTLAVWLAAATDARFLVTSRELLRLPGEIPIEVGPLSLPTEAAPSDSEAVQLFVDRARRVLPGFQLAAEDEPALVEIVQRLDGMPLAIELAAARIGVLSLEDIRERLGERFALLTRSSKGSGSARQSTLQTAIDWSWSLLEPWERTAMEQASVFRGGFPLQAAEAIFDLSAHDDAPWAADVIQTLCEKSLLRRYTASGRKLRFAMYESIAEYARAKAEASREARGAETRHTAYYLQVCGELADGVRTHGGPARLRAIDRERDNLLAVHQRAVARGGKAGADAALRAIRILDPLLSLRGPLDAHLALLDASIRLADEAGAEPSWLAPVLVARGRARRMVGRIDDSVSDFERARTLATELGNRELVGQTIRYLGVIAQGEGRTEDARRLYEDALAIHRAESDRRFEGLTLSSIGLLEMELGDYDRASQQFNAAIALLRETGDLESEAVSLANLGLVDQLQGRNEEALQLFQEALAIHRQMGQRRFEGIVLGYIGTVHHDQGQLDEATVFYRKAMAILGEIGDRRFEGLFAGYIGVVHHERGDLESASRYYDLAIQRLEAFGDPRLHGLFLSFRGALLADAGQLPAAAGALDRAGELIARSGDPLLGKAVALNRAHLDLARDADRAAADARMLVVECKVPDAASGGARPPIEQSDDVRMALRLLERVLS